jgi:hypothetical protein
LYEGQEGKPHRQNPATHRNGGDVWRLSVGAGKTEDNTAFVPMNQTREGTRWMTVK